MKKKHKDEFNLNDFNFGEFTDFEFDEKYLRPHGFQYLGGSLIKFKENLSDRITDLTLLEDKDLPIILKPFDLSNFLGIHYFTLKKYCLMKKEISPKEFLYRSFKIKKKSSGHRRIFSPKIELRNIQQKIFVEILKKIEPSKYSHGFREKYSIVTNAKVHLNSKMIYNIDLKNFFPSIKFDKILDVFKKVGYSGLISCLLAKLCTVDPRFYDKNKQKFVIIKKKLPFLPQGACTSPILSNLVCINIDNDLNKIANKSDFKYSRYADDLTFSSEFKNKLPEGFRKEIFGYLRTTGFQINIKKERYSRRFKPNVVTGIVINKGELSLPRNWVRNLRAAIHNLKNITFDEKNQELRLMLRNIEGKCSYAQMVNKKKYSHFFYEFNNIRKLKFKNIDS